MRKRKLALIPLIALALTACGNLPSATSNAADAGTVTSSAPASSAPASSKPASSKPASSAPASSVSKDSSTSSAPVEKKDWNAEFKEGLALLNPNTVVPYINEFGDDYMVNSNDDMLSYYGLYDVVAENPTFDGDSDDPKVPTEVDEEAYFTAMLSEFADTGYTAKVKTLDSGDIPGHYFISEYAIEAVSDDGATTIYIYFDYQTYGNNAGYLTMSIVARTNYDKDSFVGYDATEMAECTAFLDGHEIPEIYLANTTAKGGYPSYLYGKSYYVFEGGSWYDQVLTDAKATLEADGWTVSISDDFADFMNYWPSSIGLVATKTFSDGCTVQIEIGDYGSYSKTAQMRVYLIEKYDESSVSAWQDSTAELMENNLGGNKVPFIYLGTKSEKATYEEATNPEDSCIIIKGNAWDDAILENAKSILSADGYVITENESSYYWYDGNLVTGTKTFADGSIVVVEVSYEYSVKIPEIRIYYSAPWVVPSTATGWKEATLFAIEDGTEAGVTIPYIYLGAENGNDVEMTSLVEEDNGTYYVEILGGTLSKTFVVYAKKVFEDANWVLSGRPTYASSDGFTASMYLDDGNLVVVQVGSDWSGQITVRILYEKKIDVDPEKTWTDATKAFIEQYFGDDVEIPYLYLGVDNENIYHEEACSYSPEYVGIEGGLPGTLLQEYVEKTFADAGWTVKTGNHYITTGDWASGQESEENCVVATLNDSGYTYYVEYGPYYTGTVELHIFRIANFMEPAEGEDWSYETETALDAAAGGHDIPFLCLQAEKNTLTDEGINRYYGSGHKFTGGVWNEQCIDYIKAELEDAGYEVTITYNTDQDYCMGTGGWCTEPTVLIQGTKTFEDGSTVTLEIGDYYGMTAMLYVLFDEPYKVPSVLPEIPEKVEAEFEYYMHGFTLPESLYIGSVITGEFTSYSSSYQITGTNWGDDVITDIQKEFTDAGWTLGEVTEATEYSSATVSFTKTNSLDEEVMALVENGDGKIVITFTYTQEDVKDEKQTEYPDFIKDEMKDKLGFTIPFVYMGSKNPTWQYTDGCGQIYVNGDCTSEYVIDALKNDSEHVWTVVSGEGEDDNYIKLQAPDGNGGYYVIMTEKNATSYNGLYLFHYDAFTAPSDDFSWSSTIQNKFQSYFGTDIPVVVLDIDNKDIDFSDYFEDMGEFDVECYTSFAHVNYQDLYDYSVAQFKKDSDWVVTESVDPDTGYDYFTAKKDMGETSVVVKYYLSIYDPDSANVMMEVTREYNYIYPETPGDWNSTVAGYLESYFGGAPAIRWIYLGCPDNDVKAYYDSWDNELTIYGGTWNDDIVAKAKGSLEATGWTVTVDEAYHDEDDPSMDTPASLSAEYVDENGNTYTISIEYDEYTGVKMEIIYEPYVDPTEEDGGNSYSPIIIPGFTC